MFNAGSFVRVDELSPSPLTGGEKSCRRWGAGVRPVETTVMVDLLHDELDCGVNRFEGRWGGGGGGGKFTRQCP